MALFYDSRNEIHVSNYIIFWQCKALSRLHWCYKLTDNDFMGDRTQFLSRIQWYTLCSSTEFYCHRQLYITKYKENMSNWLYQTGLKHIFMWLERSWCTYSLKGKFTKVYNWESGVGDVNLCIVFKIHTRNTFQWCLTHSSPRIDNYTN